MKLIDKDALVAEMNRQQRKLCLLGQSHEVELRKSAAIQNGVYCRLLSFLNTLEAKEVDLEKEIAKYLGDDWTQNTPKEVQLDMIGYAKHFFALGLKAQKGE